MPHLVFSFVKLQAVLSSDKVAVAKNVQGFQTKFFLKIFKGLSRVEITTTQNIHTKMFSMIWSEM